MKTIEDLFFGNNIPFELPAIDPDERRHLSELLNRIEDPFLKEMTKEQRKTYSDCMEARLDIEIAEMRDAFVRGFRMGARLMLETLTEEAAIKTV